MLHAVVAASREREEQLLELVGRTVAGRYHVERLLGAGGMGAVWLAEHLTLQTQVVVKFMSPELTIDDVARQRFAREAAAAAAVKSPHVVQVLDHGVNGETPFIIMELLEGEDLRARMERERLVTPAELDPILSQTCKALAQAHTVGIVHRDIKPENIFLCRHDGEVFVKLLDFGIAKKVDTELNATKTGAMLGTPYYMSPEQALGLKDIDLRTDLWSLGVVAFEALAGARAFDGETIGALAVAITNGPMPVPSKLNPALPATIDAWFVRACAREPAARFGSAKELAAAFHAAAQAVSHFAATVSAALPPAAPAALGNTTTSPTSQEEASGLPRKSGARWAAAVATLAVLAGAGVFARSKLAGTDAASSASTAPPASNTTITASSGAASDVIPSALVSSATAPSASAAIAPVVSAPPRASAPPVRRVAPDAGAKPASIVSAPPSARVSCNPPFYFDGQGNKVFKSECVQ